MNSIRKSHIFVWFWLKYNRTYQYIDGGEEKIHMLIFVFIYFIWLDVPQLTLCLSAQKTTSLADDGNSALTLCIFSSCCFFWFFFIEWFRAEEAG